MKCERCLEPNPATLIMSKFNTELICDVCKSKERQHRKYKLACDAELEAIKKGDYNFPGIGKPHDL